MNVQESDLNASGGRLRAQLGRRLSGIALAVALISGFSTPAASADSGLDDADLPDGITAEEAEALIAEEDSVTAEDFRRESALDELAETASVDFYRVPNSLPAQDGTLIREQAGRFLLDPISGIAHDASVTNFMYRTTDSQGQARGAVATLLEPTRGRVPAGGRQVVVQAPATRGLADECAPSRQQASGDDVEGLFTAAALEAGYVVIIPDYIGLGTGNNHTYINRTDQAHAVLDAAIAAQQLDRSPVTESSPIAIRGYSQGGAAAAAALEVAPERNPGLNIVSGVAGAPPADLLEVAQKLEEGSSATLALYSLAGFENAGLLDPAEVLNEEGLALLERVRGLCLTAATAAGQSDGTARLTLDGRTFPQILRDDRFASVIADARLGTQGAPRVPVQVGHSRYDDTIPFATGRGLAARWCAAGSQVELAPNSGIGHVMGAVTGLPRMAAFTRQVFEGRSVANSCWRLR